MCGGYRSGILFLLVMCFLPAGCSVPLLPKYPVQQAESYPHVLAGDGLQLVAEPLFDSQQNKTYFGTDLVAEKTLPVFVLVKNSHLADSCVVFSDKIFLKGMDSEPMSAEGEVKAADPSGGITLSETSSFVGGVPLMLVGLSHISNSVEIRRNFKAKAFQTNTLSPGERCQGFVYFRLPENMTQADNPFIAIEVLNLQQNMRRTYQIPIAWKENNK